MATSTRPLQGAPRKQPNSRRLEVLLHGNSVITPLRHVGDVTVMLRKRRGNMDPAPTKSLVPNLAELTPRQVVCMYQKRWAIALVPWERKFGLGLDEHQGSGMQDRAMSYPLGLRCWPMICGAGLSLRDGPWTSLEYFSAPACIATTGHDESDRL